MDEFLVFLGVIIVLVIIVLPIMVLAKLSSISSRIKAISYDLLELKRSAAHRNPIVSPQAKPEEAPEAPIVEEPSRPEEEPTPVMAAPEPEEPTIEPEIKTTEPQLAFRRADEVVHEEVVSFARPTTAGKQAAPASEGNSILKKWFSVMSFENLLSKIGIVTLVLGIAFFVKYAIDKDWINEVGRVGIGIATGGILIAIAYKLRKLYNLFSAIMVGGGISVLYITITLAFREYHLFNQTAAFAILIAITIFSVILSLVYDRKELALFSLLGGYASPLMISTGEGNYVVLFSFLLILNSGILLISMRKKWGIVGIVSFVCTHLFYWVWLLLRFEEQYTAGALIFAALFFAQFYLLALIDHFRTKQKFSVFQIGMILGANLSMFAAAIYIFNANPVKIAGLITISMAVVNAVVLTILFRRGVVDKRLLYLVIGLVLSFISLAIPVQLNGHVITMFWAAEIVVLLWLWVKSGIKVLHIGSWLMIALTLVSYLMDVGHVYFQLDAPLPVIFNRIFITGLIVIAALVASRFLIGRIETKYRAMERSVLGYCIAVTAYMVSFLEIAYQFENSVAIGISSFTSIMLVTYTAVYVAVLTFILRKKIQTIRPAYIALCLFVVAYLLLALFIITNTWDSIGAGNYGRLLFAIHYVTLPALAYVFYILAKGLNIYSKPKSTLLGWFLVAATVIILSVALDSTVVLFGYGSDSLRTLLYDTHTIGYPILWSVLAMILMVWGLKAKKALLRQISLGFFALIILKFYINDIWLMSQAGRIISFVILGIILLFVSFLIQKIKALIKDDDTTEAEQ